MDEFGLIARFFAPLAESEPGALGLKDDAAVLDLEPGSKLVVTTDAMVAGVHFFSDDPAPDIARKLMRANLSDLAAMGAMPRGVLVAAMLPRDVSEDWLAGFAAGLADDIGIFDAPLVGGDTTSTPGPLSFSLTALGSVRGAALTRSGARDGDDVYVSGTIGDAALGLMVLKGDGFGLDDETAAPLVSRYLVPEPRVTLGRALAEGGIAHSCVDVSDGIIADLGHIADCSGLKAEITAGSVPLSGISASLMQDDPALLATMLTGGDDYELCFTAPASAREKVAATAKQTGVSVTLIGRMIRGSGVIVTDAEALGLKIESGGYTHF